MDPSDKITNQEKKIKSLEQDLNDLRQGLTLVRDYYRDLEPVSRQQDAIEAVDEQVTRQLMDDDVEFEGIWKFHEDVLVPNPEARVPSERCTRRCPVLHQEREARGGTGRFRICL